MVKKAASENERELEILRHTLGFDRQTGTGRMYRNHFCSNKNADDYEILERLVASGEMKRAAPTRSKIYHPEDIFYYATEQGITRARAPKIPGLTFRESEIFHMIGEGMPNREIAVRLGRSPRTIEAHRMHILTKLGLASTVDLIKFGIRNKFISL